MPGTQAEPGMRADDRGVVFTIEALLAVGVLLAVLFASIQMIPASHSSIPEKQLDESQIRLKLTDVISQSDNSAGSPLPDTAGLPAGVLYWNPDAGRWWGASDRGEGAEYMQLTGGVGPGGESHPLESTVSPLESDGIQYNIHLRLPDGTIQPISYMGAPGSNSVSITYPVRLSDNHRLIAADGTFLEPSDISCMDGDPNGSGYVEVVEVAEDPDCNFYINDQYPDSGESRFASISLEITGWSR